MYADTRGGSNILLREAEMAKPKQGKKQIKKTGDQICFPNCKLNRKEDDSMILCHICQVWAHIQCIEESNDDIIGTWCCNNCRKLPYNVSILCDKINNLERDMATLLQYARSLHPTNKHYNNSSVNNNLCDNTSDSPDKQRIIKRRSGEKKLVEVTPDPMNQHSDDTSAITETHNTENTESVHVPTSTVSRHENTNRALTAITTSHVKNNFHDNHTKEKHIQKKH